MSTFHEKVVYQIYPKSFKDSNGDGVGDLKGIIEKIPYLAELGVDVLWINPFFISPQKDNGYDIANYVEIDPLFGTMEDFEELIVVTKEYKLEVMLDMVLNHTSIEHEWFQKALKGEKKYQDYYILREPKSDGSHPTNWVSKFGGPAWAPFANTGKEYLHLYDVSQADLDWRNPEVREEVFNVVNFWLEKGVKGFRFDVINVIGKDEELLDAEDNIGKSLYTDRPIAHEFIHEMNQKTFGRYSDIMTVGEMSSTTIENGIAYSNPDKQELSMVFSFHHLKVDYLDGEKWSKTSFDFIKLKELLNDWQEGMSYGNGWNALFWNNHDQPRVISRFGDPVNHFEASAKLFAQSIHLLRGTPYIYQGEEIGMTDPEFQEMTDYVDIETHNAYKELKAKNLPHEEIMEIIKSKSRDNSRTPMQWTNEENAGFTSGEPWIKLADNYHQINVEKEQVEGSIFEFYKKLIQLRKEMPVISEGSYRGIMMDHPSVYGYVREYEGEQLLVLNHFYAGSVTLEIPEEFLTKASRYLIGNGKERSLTTNLELGPYETIAFYFEAK
ncbi:alpha,alpha-phosphotrehalase [Carnobacterium viridans]|uniref:Alpha,alpha-phosphotrehalase n=1 Tax=Carnobacterium viridans TaxID=174587 RepID=A0A1H1A3X8_9LACT|nr:alpha,alpha-phosphotrehalase [Carnobacterium viridans]UDE94332.1 alpha,alpha-phosphotrehalase [Carnobacterium viridans]SDQ34016.1 trehalose-6-phosphate hydrolase [Carnobacterium viridans]